MGLYGLLEPLRINHSSYLKLFRSPKPQSIAHRKDNFFLKKEYIEYFLCTTD